MPEDGEKLSCWQEALKTMPQAISSCYVDDGMARRYLQDVYLERMKNLNIKPVSLKLLFLPHL